MASGGGAIFATVVDFRNPARRQPKSCHYHSSGFMGTPAFPYFNQTTVTGPHPSPPITIIFQQLGGHYAVECELPGHWQFGRILAGLLLILGAPSKTVQN